MLLVGLLTIPRIYIIFIEFPNRFTFFLLSALKYVNFMRNILLGGVVALFYCIKNLSSHFSYVKIHVETFQD